MSVMQWTLEGFLREAAGPAPTPGGGSASAYSGALAAAMLCMAARLTTGESVGEKDLQRAASVEREAAACLQRLQEGVSRDIAVFDAFMETLRLPRATETEKQDRAAKLRLAYFDATESPLTIAENTLRVIELACDLAPVCNKNVVSDVGVAASLALGSFNAALWSVEINLASMLQDKDYVTQVRAKCRGWQDTAVKRNVEAATLVSRRI
ncbi:MAG: cyclodeaminase/cyclohydrolase family protein [Gracilibacteraceae bacterium]|nr:cyclodeaminase/cyclohydrolase family protein [Gracilibacteraceae bacterium]